MNLHVGFGGSIQEQLCRLQHGVLLPATFNALPRCLFAGVYADVDTGGVKGSELTAISHDTYSALIAFAGRPLALGSDESSTPRTRPIFHDPSG